MAHPRELEIKNYTYHLPEERIAKHPLAERDASKLLIYKSGKILEDVYRNISKYIPQNSLLIFNNTKVIQARLFFKNSTGAKIEIFCLAPAEKHTDMALVMNKKKSVRWNCLIGRANKWKEKTLTYSGNELTLSAKIIEKNATAFVVEFTWQPENFSFAEVLEKAGVIPIPPYLKRESEEIDTSRYQTVYAKQSGSVAAPTAGLHFTENVLAELKFNHICTNEITLHVGAGTFKPVKNETLQAHEMHTELIDVKQETIENILSYLDKTIIAVGTTSLRTIETLYWMGVKAIHNPQAILKELEIKQWEVYESFLPCTSKEALEALLCWMKKKQLQRFVCQTQILIAPPYPLKIAGALITNFHQPNSTLLLLVAAVVGGEWKEIYNYAMEHDFRFLSYGDGSLLFRTVL